jgi:hypothetical protein
MVEATSNGTIVLNNNFNDANYGTNKADGGTFTLNVADSGAGGGNFHTMKAVSGGTFTINGSVANWSDATITASGHGSTFNFLNGAYLTGVDNEGSILAEHHGIVSFGHVGIENNGTIDADGGKINFDHSQIYNGGLIEATGGGTLDARVGNIHAGTCAQGITINDGTLLVDAERLKLTGDGDVTLESQNDSLLTENAHSSLLTVNSGDLLFLDLDNFHNTIEGAGTIGSGEYLKLLNQAQATINANVSCAMLTLDTGNTIINKGTLEATGGGELDIQDGKIHNAGTIDNGDGIIVDSGSELVVDTATLKLTGSGDVTLENGTLENGGMITESASYVLAHSGAILTLDNIDNTIEGAGTIGTGDGHFKLENRADATIDANVSGAMLTLDTGNTIINKGVLEATGGGTLIVDDAVKGSGAAAISGGSTADFQSAFNQNVTFSGGGTFEFNSSLSHPYTATITGFGAGDTMDLANLTYSSSEYDIWTQTSTLNGGRGTLAIYSGADTLEQTLHLKGIYTQNEFALASDGSTANGGSGGTDLNFKYVSFLTGQTNNNGNVTPQIGNAGSTLEPTDGNYDAVKLPMEYLLLLNQLDASS